MAARFAAAIITLLIHLAVCAIVFVFMLIAMNGFSERDASWGIGTFAILAVLVTAAVSAFAPVLARRFADRPMNVALAVLLAVVVCSVAGAVLIGASGFGGVVVAEIARRSR